MSEFKQFGIDTSYHQEYFKKQINWETVKNAGVKFVILRCGYGSEHPKQEDIEFDNNYDEIREVGGLAIGVYHYLYATTVEGAIEEAEWCMKIIQGKQFELPIFLDIEDKVHFNLSREQNTALVYAFCEHLEKHGYFAGVYTYDSFFNTHLDKKIEDRFAIACARYNSEPPQYCTKYGIWQNSGSGRVDGIEGDVDTDYMYVNYPLIIKNAGLNGFSKPEQYVPKFKITGTKENLTEAESLTAREELTKLGFNTLLQRQED